MYDQILSNDEVIQVLTKYSNKLKLKNYKINKAPKSSIGYLGEYFNLLIEVKNIETNEKENLNFFIKTLPVTNLQERLIFEEFGLFKKEVGLYDNFLNHTVEYDLKKWCAKCYYTRSDLLVFEDLFDLNYKQFDKFNTEHMKAVLQSLARLHASSIAFEAKNNLNLQEKFSDILFETSVGEKIEWFRVGLEAIRAVLLSHPKYQSSTHQDFILNNFYKAVKPIYGMVNPSKVYKNVICHRDAWGRNIFFKEKDNVANNDDCDDLTAVLIDFQTCRYCPAAIDVLFIIYLNTNRNARDQSYKEWLEWYYTQLETNSTDLEINIANHITHDDFLKSYEDLRLFGILYLCIALTLIYLPEGFLINFKRNEPEKYAEFAYKNRKEIILKVLSEDDEYRRNFYEALEELMEFIYV